MRSCRHLHGAFLALAVTAIFVGCASTGAPMPPTLELPKPPADLTAQRKGDKVYLRWTQPELTTDRQSIRHLGATRVCRSPGTPLEHCDQEVGEVPRAEPDVASHGKKAQDNEKMHYTDTLEAALQQQSPLAQFTYAVEVLNQSGRGAGPSNRVQVPAAPTLGPPGDFTASVTASGVALAWTGMAEQHDIPEISHGYRVFRREEGTQNATPIADLPLAGASETTVVDHSFEWEKKYEYRLTVVTFVSQPSKPEVQVEGDDAISVTVFAHDVFPPGVPTGLQAVASGIEQKPFVDLIWAPDSDADLAGYNVYRSEAGSQPAKLNAEPVKTPAYRDSSVRPGKSYVYSVTAIDVRSNESGRSEEASESVQ
jgi:hypothetical protein